jgi:hypothetical protein
MEAVLIILIVTMLLFVTNAAKKNNGVNRPRTCGANDVNNNIRKNNMGCSDITDCALTGGIVDKFGEAKPTCSSDSNSSKVCGRTGGCFAYPDGYVKWWAAYPPPGW